MIKTTIAGALAALALSGCISAEQQAANQAAFDHFQTVLGQAQERATVDCTGAAVCDKVWMLTKSYVQQESSTAVRLSDETMIDTFAPIEYGRATFAATGVPDGQKMVVKLTGACLGMYNRDGTRGPNYSECATRVGMVQSLFLRYLHERM